MSADILLKIVVVVYVASTLAACSGKFVCKNKRSGRLLLVTVLLIFSGYSLRLVALYIYSGLHNHAESLEGMKLENILYTRSGT